MTTAQTFYRHYSPFCREKNDPSVAVHRCAHAKTPYIPVPRWLTDLIPAAIDPSFGIRLMMLTGLFVRGDIVRKAAVDKPTEVCRGVDKLSPSLFGWIGAPYDLHGYENEMLDQFADEAHVSTRTAAYRTCCLLGSGVVGALDGLMTSPWKAYSCWSTVDHLSADTIVRMKHLLCLDLNETNITEYSWFADSESAAKEVLRILSNFGSRGWFHDEFVDDIEAGRLSVWDVVSRPRIEFMIKMITDLKQSLAAHV